MSLISWNPFREVDSISRDKAEIPGVSKEDLNVYVDENSIRLSGETKN